MDKPTTEQYAKALNFIKKHNPNISYGIVFTEAEGRKHRLWFGSEQKCAFRLSLKAGNQINLKPSELTDVKRALVLAMQQLDATGNKADVLLADRLEILQTKLDDQ